MKHILLIVLFLISCKSELDSNLKNSILDILNEQQKVYEYLLANPDALPEVGLVVDSVKKAKSLSEKNADLKNQLEKLETVLVNINKNDKEAFFVSLSSFSETLSDIVKGNNIQTNYNKFYCPMVSKYWVAKGETIENPYAPEMRECGEVIK